MSLRILIADDELLNRRRLVRLLEAMEDVVLAGECCDGVEVLARLKEGGVDVVLLDVQMPRLTGLEAMALMAEDGPAVVFTTAYAEHAVEAFERDAVDYLLKPIEAERLAAALDRVRRRMALSEPTPLDGRLFVPTRKGLVLLSAGDVTHAVIEGTSCLIYTAGERYITDFRLNELERRLPASFERVHRQALLNLDHLARLEPVDGGRYRAHTTTGEVVPVSRQAARELRRRWDLPRG